MSAESTISFADLYGAVGPGRAKGETMPPDVQKASGTVENDSGKNPSYFWAGLIVLLVVIRFLWEQGK